MKWNVRYYEFESSSRRYIVCHKVMIASGCEDIISQLGSGSYLIDIERID